MNGAVNVRIGNLTLPTLIDTGAKIVVITQKMVQAMGLNENKLIPVTKIKATNIGGLTLMGGS